MQTVRGGALGALGTGAREGICPMGICALRTGGVSGIRPGALAADSPRRIDRPRAAHAGRFSIDWVAARVFNAGLPEYHFLIM